METIGFVIKSPSHKRPVKSLYHTVGTARMVATRFNNQGGRFGNYEVFEITGLKKVEK